MLILGAFVFRGRDLEISWPTADDRRSDIWFRIRVDVFGADLLQFGGTGVKPKRRHV